ncbi:MAG: VWA domain-containing protein [Candidatus Aminicenantes bacterium]|nr:VWA domain-containing protein [Candidatus Aminicenantes bacterium]
MNKSFFGIVAVFFVLTGPYLGFDKTALPALQEQTQLRHEVNVTLKLVQVYVTDKKGNPVLDLTKDDFLVLDEGQKQPITEFEKHVLSLPPKKEEGQLEVIETPASPARDLMPRKFFLIFDFAYNNGIGIEKSRKAALHFVETQLQPQDEVGVLSYSSMKSLTLHEHLTTDHKTVRQAIKRIGIERIAGRAESFEEEYWQAKANVNPGDASRPGSVFDAKDLDPRNVRTESKMQARNFAQKIMDLAKALRYIPGQKCILFLSSGVPHSLVGGIQSPYGKIGVQDLGDNWLHQMFEDMLKELSSANCTIYALDTQEQAASLDSDMRMQGAFSLQRMTSATGGKYFGNINNYEQHIDKIQGLTGCYYVLGYYVDDKWDGAYHKIKVEATRPDCKVHAQKGYFNPKPVAEYNDLEKMLHLVDLALSEEPLFQTPVRFALEVVPCELGGKGNLCLAADVPLEKIQEILTGKSEFVAVIFDDKENISALKRNEREGSALMGKWFSFGAAFSLPPGTYKCRLVIRNLQTGRAAVASATAVIPGE